MDEAKRGQWLNMLADKIECSKFFILSFSGDRAEWKHMLSQERRAELARILREAANDDGRHQDR
jgi:hypothetical protein